jgi:hypothetical protein
MPKRLPPIQKEPTPVGLHRYRGDSLFEHSVTIHVSINLRRTRRKSGLRLALRLPANVDSPDESLGVVCAIYFREAFQTFTRQRYRCYQVGDVELHNFLSGADRKLVLLSRHQIQTEAWHLTCYFNDPAPSSR